MRAGHGTRARRSGVTRGKDTPWFREQIARDVDPPADADIRVRSAEREIESLRKATLRALAADQRVGRNADTSARTFRRFEDRIATHLTAHHGIEVTVTRDPYGATYKIDGGYTSGWRMDDLHEQAHGRP
jgi:hypothetical protein